MFCFLGRLIVLILYKCRCLQQNNMWKFHFQKRFCFLGFLDIAEYILSKYVHAGRIIPNRIHNLGNVNTLSASQIQIWGHKHNHITSIEIRHFVCRCESWRICSLIINLSPFIVFCLADGGGAGPETPVGPPQFPPEFPVPGAPRPGADQPTNGGIGKHLLRILILVSKYQVFTNYVFINNLNTSS